MEYEVKGLHDVMCEVALREATACLELCIAWLPNGGALSETPQCEIDCADMSVRRLRADDGLLHVWGRRRGVWVDTCWSETIGCYLGQLTVKRLLNTKLRLLNPSTCAMHASGASSVHPCAIASFSLAMSPLMCRLRARETRQLSSAVSLAIAITRMVLLVVENASYYYYCFYSSPI